MKPLLLLALCACATARSFTAADRSDVSAVLEAQVAAWNREDLAGYMDKYARSEQLVFTSAGKVRRGWQATYDAFRTKYATAPGTMGQLQFEVLQIDPAGADGCVVLGRWTLTSGAHPATGLFTVVLERQAAGWRVIHDHTSADP